MSMPDKPAPMGKAHPEDPDYIIRRQAMSIASGLNSGGGVHVAQLVDDAVAIEAYLRGNTGKPSND